MTFERTLVFLLLTLGVAFAESEASAESDADADAFYSPYGGHLAYGAYGAAYPYHHHPRAAAAAYYSPYTIAAAAAAAPGPLVPSRARLAPLFRPAQYVRQAVPAIETPVADAIVEEPAVIEEPAVVAAAALEPHLDFNNHLKAVPAVPDLPVLPNSIEPALPVAAAPALLPAPVPAVPSPIVPTDANPTVATQYHSQDEFGNVAYGYANPNSAKQETRDAYGNVIGAYSYVDASGLPKHVTYVADDFGFRVTSSNALPIHHLPEQI